MTSLYDKYLRRAQAAFAQRDADLFATVHAALDHRDADDCPPDPEAAFWMAELNDRLNRMHANDMRLLHLPAAPAPDATGRERECAGEGTL